MPAIIRVVEGRTIISVGENTALASKYATLAEQFANEAELSAETAALAAAAVGVYTTVGDGEAATTNGQSFYVASGGTVTLYINNAGTGDEVASLATASDVAARVPYTELASTAPGEGAALVGDNIGLTGATDGDASQLFREHVSLSRFVPKSIFSDLMNGDHTGDISAYINSALDSGENIVNPFRLSCIAAPIQIKYNGQSFTSKGTYTNEIHWITNEPTLNMVELWSGRRDLGGSPAKTNQLFSGALLSSAIGSSMANALWIENGQSHPTAERLRFLNFYGDVTQSVLKMDSGGGYSYSLGLTLRDIVITSINHDPYHTAGIPKGVWVESGIEFEFDMVKVFNVSDAFVFGSPDTFRTIEDSSLRRCHVEIGNRRGGANDATGMRFYGGSNLNIECKINAAINDTAAWPNVTDQTCVEFMAHPDYHPMRNINFWGSRFWQYSLQNRELVYFNSGADVNKVMFDSPRVVGVTNTPGFIGTASDFDADIQVRNPNLAGISKAAPLANLAGRRNVSHDATSIDPGAFTIIDLSNDDDSAYGLPVAVSANINLQGTHLSWYKASATGINRFSLWNPPDGTTRDFAEARYTMRFYQPEDIRAAVSKLWDPPAINTNIGTTTTIACPGARIGDFVKAGFAAKTVGGMASAICEAWVSADNEVTVRLFNPNINKNFAPDLLTVFHLAPTFDYIATATYDPPSLATLTSAGTSVSVTGASLGDFVEVSFSNDLAGVFMWGEVTAADTVTVRLFNSTTGTVDLASGTVTVGVRKRHTRF